MFHSVCFSHPVQIYIAGNIVAIENECQKYCDEVGLCVNVSPTNYIYTGGQEYGARIELINYARFPSAFQQIFNHALELAKRVRIAAFQQSFTIQTPAESHWYSWREADNQLTSEPEQVITVTCTPDNHSSPLPTN